MPAANLKLLRINDVGQLLRISKPTFWRMRRGHAFPKPTDVTGRAPEVFDTLRSWLLTRIGPAGPASTQATVNHAPAGQAK